MNIVDADVKMFVTQSVGFMILEGNGAVAPDSSVVKSVLIGLYFCSIHRPI